MSSRFIWELPTDVRGLIGNYLTISDLLIFRRVCKNPLKIFPKSTPVGEKLIALFREGRAFPHWSALRSFAKFDCLEELNIAPARYGIAGKVQIMLGYREAKNILKLIKHTPKLGDILGSPTTGPSRVSFDTKVIYFTIIDEGKELFRIPETDKYSVKYFEWISGTFSPTETFLTLYTNILLYALNPTRLVISPATEKIGGTAYLDALLKIYSPSNECGNNLIVHAKCHLGNLLKGFKNYLKNKAYDPGQIASTATLEFQKVILQMERGFFDGSQLRMLSNPYLDVLEYWKERLDFSKLTHAELGPILYLICGFRDPYHGLRHTGVARPSVVELTEFKRYKCLLEIIFIPRARERIDLCRETILGYGPSTMIIEMIKILQKNALIRWSDVNGFIGSRSEYSFIGESTVHSLVKRWAEETEFIPAKKQKKEK